MSDLNGRNTASVAQELRALGDVVRAQQVRIDGLVSTLGNMQERLGALEIAVNVMRAAAMGRGASVGV